MKTAYDFLLFFWLQSLKMKYSGSVNVIGLKLFHSLQSIFISTRLFTGLPLGSKGCAGPNHS
jgi:hypothetical protein